MDLSKTFILSASYYYAKNGRQSIDLSLPQSLQATALASLENVQGRQTIHTLRVGMGIRVEKQTQLLFQLNQDLAAENAPISRGFFVRVTHLFFPPPKPSTSRPDFGSASAQQPPAAPEPASEPASDLAPEQGRSP